MGEVANFPDDSSNGELPHMTQPGHQEFLTLLEPIYERLLQYIRSITGGPEEARDLLGETILIGYENHASLRKKESFDCYLFKTARRLNRRMQWRSRLFLPLEIQHVDLWLDAPSPDAQADFDDIQAMIDKLPAKEKESFLLFFVSGLSQEEIRAIQGGTLSGVKSRIASAKKRLVKLLADPSEHAASMQEPFPGTNTKVEL